MRGRTVSNTINKKDDGRNREEGAKWMAGVAGLTLRCRLVKIHVLVG